MTLDPIFLRNFRTLLAEVTAHELDAIRPDSVIEEELNIDSETDVPRIIRRINATYGITLDAEIMEEVETVEDLAKRVYEEVELG